MSLYDILKIDKCANREEIERAYKKLARQTHPTISKNKTDDFIKINRAYEILKDKEKRNFYNLWGEASLKVLDNNDEAFIIVRCFDFINFILYACIFGIWIINFGVLPFFIYKGYPYLYTCFPSILAGFLTIVPYVRAFFKIEKFQRSALHLRSMLYLSFKSMLISSYLLLPSLYFCIEDYLFFFIFMITLLEFVSSAVIFFLAFLMKIMDIVFLINH